MEKAKLRISKLKQNFKQPTRSAENHRKGRLSILVALTSHCDSHIEHSSTSFSKNRLDGVDKNFNLRDCSVRMNRRKVLSFSADCTGKELQNAEIKACLSDLRNVPADKAPNNIIIICKRYYIETLIKESGLDNCSSPTGSSTPFHVRFRLRKLSILMKLS